MASQQSRDELRAELLSRGLPRTYIARLLAELDDHFTDLVEERNSRMGAARKLQFDAQDAEQRLGEPTQLAIFAAEQYHARGFFGRHPVVTFLIGPLPLFVMGWLVAGATIFAAGVVLEGVDLIWTAAFNWSLASMPPESHPWLQGVALALLCWIVLVVPPLLSGWVLCRVAERNRLDWKWPALGCGLLAMLAAVMTATYRIRTIGGTGLFMVGINASTSSEWWLATFLPRFAVAMGIGLLLVKRAQQRLGFEA